MATSAQLSFADVEAAEEPAPRTSSLEVEQARLVSRSGDQAALAALEAALAALEAALVDARASVGATACTGPTATA
jgi:hypothetical protein